MSTDGQDDSDKSFDATPQKLEKARNRGEVAKSTDLSVAAAYTGLLMTALAVGADSLGRLGNVLLVLLDQPDQMAQVFFSGSASRSIQSLILGVGRAMAPWFAIPALAVLLSILGQRAFVFAPSKIQPKLSRISITSNAANKFGRAGLFKFVKSLAKLVLYSICLGLFLRARLVEVVAISGSGPHLAVVQLVRLCAELMVLVLLIAIAIGGIDAIWQHNEHLRKNKMSRKEVTDESKEAEGDPHVKQQRRQRGHEIAMNQMMADVPTADVVIVNPTHFAVALKWSRTQGSAPVCIAKGVDEIAASIRRAANLAGVPIHHDPPTARALHATVELGQEISEDHYRAVAAAIRFSEQMRLRAQKGV